MYNWKWYLSELKQDKDVTVFSTFSCGGGSSMGYKRAGFNVLGNVEIDPRMNEIYVKNNRPKHNYLMDLRDFNKLDNLPGELYHLDILDGSPPCSTFSASGDREKTWGEKRIFREGQKRQTLDDLFFVFLDTVEKLKPKIVIAENVAGLLHKNAKGYVNEIINRFHRSGYEVQLFKLNAAFMDVPQVRERVFFIANNQKYSRLRLAFDGKPILFGEIRSGKGTKINGTLTTSRLAKMRKGDRCIAEITKRTENGRWVCFNNKIIWDDRVACTLASSGEFIRAFDKMDYSKEDYINVATFPQDYDFGKESPHYVCGMSVPPNMMANIATEVWKQWLNKGGEL